MVDQIKPALPAEGAQADGRGAATDYVPNIVPRKTRGLNVVLSVLLLIYGTYSVLTDHFVLPAKRGQTVTLYGYSAWVLYAALLFLVAHLLAVVVDHYDTRNNEDAYRRFGRRTRIAAWTLYVLALILGVVKHSQDTVCENREIQRATNNVRHVTAIAFNRYCASHDPSNATDPSPQVAVVPDSLPFDQIIFGNTLRLNKTRVERMYWKDNTLVVEFARRADARPLNDAPSVKSDAPVPVMLIATIPRPSDQRSTSSRHVFGGDLQLTYSENVVPSFATVVPTLARTKDGYLFTGRAYGTFDGQAFGNVQWSGAFEDGVPSGIFSIFTKGKAERRMVKYVNTP